LAGSFDRGAGFQTVILLSGAGRFLDVGAVADGADAQAIEGVRKLSGVRPRAILSGDNPPRLRTAITILPSPRSLDDRYSATGELLERPGEPGLRAFANLKGRKINA
jgi:hypothetical protein